MQTMLRLAQATLEHMNVSMDLTESDVQVDCNYVGEGYGIANEGTIEAIELLARQEGSFWTPFTPAKAWRGLLIWCDRDVTKKMTM